MDPKKNYIFYVCEEKNSLFLKDATYQLNAANGARCIKKTYIERTSGPLMQRPEFQKVLKELYNGRCHLLIYDISVLGTESSLITKLISDFGERKIDIVVIRGNLSGANLSGDLEELLYIDAVFQMDIRNQINKNMHQNLLNSFLVFTGKDNGKIAFECFKGTILYPEAIIPLLNDDLWMQVVRASTMEIVYNFKCTDSLKHNEGKIYRDVRNLFIEKYGTTGIFILDKKYPLYFGVHED